MDEQAKGAATEAAGSAANGKDKEKGKDEVALELMKFIATSTGYGRGSQTVGFAGKGARSPEEQAESLLELFERCRTVVKKG